MFFRAIIIFAVTVFTSLASLTMEANSQATLVSKAEEIAIDAYQRINQNWHYVTTNQQGTATSSWTTKTIKTERGSTSALIWNYARQPNLLDAINEIIDQNGIRQECSNAAKLVRIKIILELLGPDHAAALIRELKHKNKDSEFNFLSELSWSFQSRQNSDGGEAFGAFAFVNIPEYLVFKPGGNDGNHNIISLSDGTMIGFAPEFFTEPRTSDELEDLLYQAFVDDNNLDNLSSRTTHQKFCSSLSREQFTTRRQDHQKQIGTYTFDFQKIEEYLQISTTKACAHCSKMKSDANLCGRCKKICYCSRDCQVANWPTHKLRCMR